MSSCSAPNGFLLCAAFPHRSAVCLFTFFFRSGFLSNQLREAGSGGPQLAKATSRPRFQSPGLGGCCGATVVTQSGLECSTNEGECHSLAGLGAEWGIGATRAICYKHRYGQV